MHPSFALITTLTTICRQNLKTTRFGTLFFKTLRFDRKKQAKYNSLAFGEVRVLFLLTFL